MTIVSPERWYQIFWFVVWLISVPPVIVLLYLIWRKL